MNWKTIDTVPYDLEVLIADTDLGIMSVGTKWLLEDGRSMWEIDCDMLEKPTHWTLLPELPHASPR